MGGRLPVDGKKVQEFRITLGTFERDRLDTLITGLTVKNVANPFVALISDVSALTFLFTAYMTYVYGEPVTKFIGDSYTAHVLEVVPDFSPPDNFNPFVPQDVGKYAGNTMLNTDNPSGNPGVHINPNADEAYLAHELGHVASTHTDVGSIVRSMRDNPKLTQALGISLMTIPGVAAAIEEGDNDLDTSIALAAATQLPTLIDEGLATKNGLAIMDLAGSRASLGQRRKLAGGLASYLMPALIAGSAGNFIGNQLD